MEATLKANQVSRMRGYTAFIICGLCVALNALAYIPTKSFREAEATEFTVTITLLVVFIISSIVAWTCAVKNRRDVVLVGLLLLSATFVTFIYFSSSFRYQVRTLLEISYAIVVLGLGSIRLLAIRRSPV